MNLIAQEKMVSGEMFRGCVELCDFVAGSVYISGWGAGREGDRWIPADEFVIFYRNVLIGSLQPNVSRQDLCKHPGFMAKSYGFSVCFPDYLRMNGNALKEDTKIYANYRQKFYEIRVYGDLSLNGRQPAPHVFRNLACISAGQFGLVDHLAIRGESLEIGGWAFFKYATFSNYASMFLIKIGNRVNVINPDKIREDVSRAYNLPPGYYGFQATLKLEAPLKAEELENAVTVVAASSDDDIFPLPLYMKQNR